MKPRLALRLLLVCGVAYPLFLVACATDVGQRWAYTHKPLPARVVLSTGEALQIMCNRVDGARFVTYYGCVERDYARGVCWVYLEPNPPAWLMEHELMHCKGFSHAEDVGQ